MIPTFLKELLIEQYGNDTTNKIINGYNNKRLTTLRVNTLKSNIDEIKEALNKESITYQKVSWYNDALIIKNCDEKTIQELNIYEEGKIYLQSLSSMIPVLLLEPKENESILDMAAAPGGKTTQISALSNGKALITACEKNKIRAERLKYNIEKQDAKRVGVLIQDARKIDDYFTFDKILLDAPCSGSGTIDLNNQKSIEYFNLELINNSVKTQKELLNKAIKLLKPGHELIYSTCSILKQENEQIIENIQKVNNIEIVPIDTKMLNDIPLLPVSIPGTICVCPNELYEGFYVAKLKKLK